MNRTKPTTKAFRTAFFAGVSGLLLFSGLSYARAAASAGDGIGAVWTGMFCEALSSDIDARDAQNRTVKSQAARSELRELFILSTLRFLAWEGLPVLARVRAALERAVNPWKHRWSRAAGSAARVLENFALLVLKSLSELLWLASMASLGLMTALLSRWRSSGSTRACSVFPAFAVPLRC